MDSEPDVPEADQQPAAASAARDSESPIEGPETGADDASATSASAATSSAAKPAPAKRTSANAAGSAAKRASTAKPATRTTASRATTPKTTTSKTTPAKTTAAKTPTTRTTAAKTTPAEPAAAKSPATSKAAPKTTPKAAPKAAPKTAATRAPAKPRSTTRSTQATDTAVAALDDALAQTTDVQTTDAPVAPTPTRAKRPAGPARKTAAPAEVVARPIVVETIDDVEVVEVLEVVEAPEAEWSETEQSEVERSETEQPAVEKPAREVAALDAAEPREVVLKISGLVKRFDDTTAVAGIDLSIEAGSFFGLVGPNGAGKTTTLSMVTGLLRPDAGTVTVHGADVWSNPVVAKRTMGVLPDRLRLFDRLTGAQLLYYSGILHGLDKSVVRSRSADLAIAFGLEDSLDRLVTDYSAGMTKKVAIAAAMIHSPRLLVLDEPFESVDPVSAANVIEILQKYVAAGGTVVMSSHTMNLIERICDSVAVVVNGAVLATGTMAEVRAGKTLEERFVELAGGRKAAEGMEWLHKFSD